MTALSTCRHPHREHERPPAQPGLPRRVESRKLRIINIPGAAAAPLGNAAQLSIWF